MEALGRRRGWVSTYALADLREVSRQFQDRYGYRVASFVVLRHSKGGLTQIEAELLPPSGWWRWFGRRPPPDKAWLVARD